MDGEGTCTSEEKHYSPAWFGSLVQTREQYCISQIVMGVSMGLCVVVGFVLGHHRRKANERRAEADDTVLGGVRPGAARTGARAPSRDSASRPHALEALTATSSEASFEIPGMSSVQSLSGAWKPQGANSKFVLLVVHDPISSPPTIQTFKSEPSRMALDWALMIFEAFVVVALLATPAALSSWAPVPPVALLSFILVQLIVQEWASILGSSTKAVGPITILDGQERVGLSKAAEIMTTIGTQEAGRVTIIEERAFEEELVSKTVTISRWRGADGNLRVETRRGDEPSSVFIFEPCSVPSVLADWAEEMMTRSTATQPALMNDRAMPLTHAPIETDTNDTGSDRPSDLVEEVRDPQLLPETVSEPEPDVDDRVSLPGNMTTTEIRSRPRVSKGFHNTDSIEVFTTPSRVTQIPSIVPEHQDPRTTDFTGTWQTDYWTLVNVYWANDKFPADGDAPIQEQLSDSFVAKGMALGFPDWFRCSRSTAVVDVEHDTVSQPQTLKVYLHHSAGRILLEDVSLDGQARISISRRRMRLAVESAECQFDGSVVIWSAREGLPITIETKMQVIDGQLRVVFCSHFASFSRAKSAALLDTGAQEHPLKVNTVTLTRAPVQQWRQGDDTMMSDVSFEMKAWQAFEARRAVKIDGVDSTSLMNLGNLQCLSSVEKDLGEVLRVVLESTISMNCGSIWGDGGGEIAGGAGAGTYAYSFAVTEDGYRMDYFLSHSWHAWQGRWLKPLATVFHLHPKVPVYSGMFTSVVVSVATAPIRSYIYDQMQNEQRNLWFAFYAAWVLGIVISCFTGATVFLVSLFFANRCISSDAASTGFFLDKCCIHQTDPVLKERGIKGIGDFLRCSEYMLVLFDETYLTRMWCVFELATFVRLKGAKGLLLVPMPIPFLSIAWIVFISLFCATGVLSGGGITGRRDIGITAAVGLSWLAISACIALAIDRRTRHVANSVRRLLSQFELSRACCFSEVDRDLVTATVVELFGTVDHFDTFVQQEITPLLQSRLASATTGAMATGAFFFLCNFFGALLTLATWVFFAIDDGGPDRESSGSGSGIVSV